MAEGPPPRVVVALGHADVDHTEMYATPSLKHRLYAEHDTEASGESLEDGAAAPLLTHPGGAASHAPKLPFFQIATYSVGHVRVAALALRPAASLPSGRRAWLPWAALAPH